MNNNPKAFNCIPGMKMDLTITTSLMMVGLLLESNCNQQIISYKRKRKNKESKKD